MTQSAQLNANASPDENNNIAPEAVSAPSTRNNVTESPVIGRSKAAIRQKAYRERKKAAGPVRIAVPCHPDHLEGLDV